MDNSSSFRSKEILEANLNKLRVSDAQKMQLREAFEAECSVEIRTDKVPYMAYKGKPFYDLLDPVGKIAREIMSLKDENKPDLIVFFGFGMGLHAEAVLKQFKVPLIVYEPDPKIAAAALSIRHMELEGVNLVFTSGHLMELTDVMLDLTDRKLKVALIPAYRELFPEQFKKFVTTLEQTMDNISIRDQTLAHTSARWTYHLAANLATFSTMQPIDVLKNKFTGKPGIFVGTGPSLDKVIPALLSAKGHAIICAANSAVQPLCKGGITPELAGIIEGNNLVSHFDGVDELDRITLLPSANTFPGHLQLPVKQMLSVSLRPSPFCDWATTAYERGSLVSGGSVACMCFAALHWLGCDPIIAVGMDLAFTDDRTHAENAVQSNMKINFKPENNKMEEFIEGNKPHKLWETATIAAWGGKGEVRTQTVFNSYRYWFEGAAQTWASDRTLINATQGGARIANFKDMPLAEALEKHCKDPLPAEAIIEKTVAEAPKPDDSPLMQVVESELKIIKKSNEMATEADKLSAKAQKLIGKGRLGDAQRVLQKLETKEKSLRKLSKKTRLLNQLVGHKASKLSRNRHEDAEKNIVKQTYKSLNRSREIFQFTRDGAKELLDLFSPALNQTQK